MPSIGGSLSPNRITDRNKPIRHSAREGKMKTFIRSALFIAFILAQPARLYALLTELPIGSTNKLVAHVVKNTEYLSFRVSLFKQDGWIEKGLGLWQFGRYYGETINTIANRSADELVKVMQVIMREIMRAVLASEIGPSLEGRMLSLQYNGRGKVFVIPFDSIDNIFTVFRDAEGKLMASENAYRVNLEEATTRGAAASVFVPGVKNAAVIVEDEAGNIIEVLNGSTDPLSDRTGVYPYHGEDFIYLRTDLAVKGLAGTFRIWYLDGSEQVFNLADGTELITYLPSPQVAKPFRKLGIPKLKAGSIELRFEATDDESIRIEQTDNLMQWSKAALSAPLSPASRKSSDEVLPMRIRTVRLPLDVSQRFYRAKVEP